MKLLIFFGLTMALSVASVSAQGDLFGSIFKAAADMVTQTLNMGMSMVKSSMDLVPFQSAIKMAEEAMMAVKDYPTKIMNIFQQGASMATNAAGGMANAAGGMANPSAMLFQQAANQVMKLKEADAPQEDYMNLMKKMKEAIA